MLKLPNIRYFEYETIVCSILKILNDLATKTFEKINSNKKLK